MKRISYVAASTLPGAQAEDTPQLIPSIAQESPMEHVNRQPQQPANPTFGRQDAVTAPVVEGLFFTCLFHCISFDALK